MAGSVLVVDDDQGVVEALRQVLAAHDVNLESAEDAAGANALLDSHEFCGMVLDLVLRTGSGFDVLHHISTKHINIPTVVVTNKLPSYVREMLDAEHVKLVFPKPVDPRLLGSIVLGLCGIAV
ncbi:MAG: response regulator [Acidobacteriota bacterium]|nr:response regulator [Acidobacteriota bacterium]